MASITIRNLDAHTMSRLRARAERRKHSIEEEARDILYTALAENNAAPRDLAAAIGERFRPLGGIDLVVPVRSAT